MSVCLPGGGALGATIRVDPGTSGTAAAVLVAGEPGEAWRAFTWSLDKGAVGEMITSSVVTATTEPLRFELPVVEADTFVEMAVTTESVVTSASDVFRWRTLARPAGVKLMDYTGQKDLLPPDDFDEYWARAVKQLDAVTSNPRVTRAADQDTTTGLCYRVELESVENTTIVGWCFVPREAFAGGNPDAEVVKQFPAVLLSPGYGGDMRPMDRTRDGYVTFSINPRNHGPSKSFWKSPVEHQLYNITVPEDYYYKLAALDCLQGARYLFDRPEVDDKHVGAEGSSQGGYLSVAVAMLEPRIRCVVAHVIAFSDYPDGMELATSGHEVRLRDLLSAEASSGTLIRQSLAYTDGVNLITRVKAPVQFNMGGVDGVCPYVCGIVAYNRLPNGVEKDFSVDPGAAHEVTGMMRKRAADWMARWLKSAGAPN